MIRHVHFVRVRRAGQKIRWYVYAYRGGPRIKVWDSAIKPLLSHAELKAVIAAQAVDHSPDPTTLLSLIRDWRSENPDRPSSPEWEKLSKGTKKTWGSALDRIEAKWGETPLEIWNDPRMTAKVVAWRDARAATPRSADIGITVLKTLLQFGRLRGRLSLNAASGIPALYTNGQRAEIVWTDEDMAQFGKAAARLGRMHVDDGLRLAALTGLRRADLVTLTWAQVNEFSIQKLALKRSAGKRRYVTMPRIPALDSLLDELRSRHRRPGVNTVLVNSYGDSWSGDGFGTSFNRVRDEADIVYHDTETATTSKKHLHDVRGTFCTKLLIDGQLTDQQAAEIMGWSPERVGTIRRVYVPSTQLINEIGKRLSHMS